MRLFLVGFGVVGRSLARLLISRREELLQRYGIVPRIIGVADSSGALVREGGLDLAKVLSLKEAGEAMIGMKGKVEGRTLLEEEVKDALRNLEFEVLVEMSPSNLRDGQPALSYLEAAIRGKKNVVTTNKGPMALAMPALLEMARHNNVQLRFSGTVGGGTPILDFGRRCLTTDRIKRIEGILNGTSNFILSRMEEGMSFEEALTLAQEKGYAEADPSLDVDGHDTAAKLVIMANWLLNMRATLKDVKIEGIRRLKTEELREARRDGKAIRLMGVADRGLSVSPKVLKVNDPICVKDVFNAVRFVTEFAGDEIIIGKGAGGMETASAVLRDLLVVREALTKGEVV